MKCEKVAEGQRKLYDGLFNGCHHRLLEVLEKELGFGGTTPNAITEHRDHLPLIYERMPVIIDHSVD